MCGICGFVESGGVRPDASAVIERMRDCMVHRGPDDAGLRVGNRYALGHRRLSIVDLSPLGHQPMGNEDGTIWVVFNGEIYNHLDIRRVLEAKGHRFVSQSDTEVLVHGWEEWGADVVHRLNGMFAFALHDERQSCTFLARDRVGIKPLYYTLGRDYFAFASEMKSVLAYPSCKAEPEMSVLGEYLMFRNVAGERTVFRGLKQLLPGCTLHVDRGLKLRVKRYWQVALADGESSVPGEPSDALRDLLRDSVRLRLMSDVPLGTQLSGGLDSSVVTAFAQDATSGSLSTYSIGLPVAGYNEAEYSNRVAQFVGTDHCAMSVTAEDFGRRLDEMVWFMDSPIDHPNSIFLYLLCKRAKHDVTVLLTGEGADELLGGYERYSDYQRAFELTSRIPGVVRRAATRLPSWFNGHKITKLRDWNEYGPTGMAIRNSAFGSRLLLSALSPEITIDLSERGQMFGAFSSGAAIDALLRLDQQTYLVSILQRQDRVSMGASVEARVPFLDHRLVEFANNLPWPSKLASDGKGKIVLKKAARGLIEDGIIDRQKMGFPIPIREWFREGGGLSERLDAVLDRNSFVGSFTSAPVVENMVNEHRLGIRNHAESLWILLSLELWHRRFIKQLQSPVDRTAKCTAVG